MYAPLRSKDEESESSKYNIDQFMQHLILLSSATKYKWILNTDKTSAITSSVQIEYHSRLVSQEILFVSTVVIFAKDLLKDYDILW